MFFWVDIATTTLGATQEAVFRVTEAMDRMASAGMNTHVQYPAGDCARGTKFGHVVNQNLADNFPVIDHFEGGAAISIKTTVTTDMPGKFVDTVGQWAAELSGQEDPLRGYTASGECPDVAPLGGHDLDIVEVTVESAFRPSSESYEPDTVVEGRCTTRERTPARRRHTRQSR